MPHQPKELNYDQVINTTIGLKRRIMDRFPESGLLEVTDDFLKVSMRTKKNIQWIEKPNYFIRIGGYVTILTGLALLVYTLLSVDYHFNDATFVDVITMSEAAMNDLVLIGAAIFFLVSLESRIKRSRSLQMLNELRSMAHVVDMHQLTKDPIVIGSELHRTEHSPKRHLNRFELERYLNYCSELLSLIGKVAALYSQSLSDEVVAQSVTEIETLTSGFSSKIWQKVSILNDYDANKTL